VCCSVSQSVAVIVFVCPAKKRFLACPCVSYSENLNYFPCIITFMFIYVVLFCWLRYRIHFKYPVEVASFFLIYVYSFLCLFFPDISQSPAQVGTYIFIHICVYIEISIYTHIYVYICNCNFA